MCGVTKKFSASRVATTTLSRLWAGAVATLESANVCVGRFWSIDLQPAVTTEKGILETCVCLSGPGRGLVPLAPLGFHNQGSLIACLQRFATRLSLSAHRCSPSSSAHFYWLYQTKPLTDTYNKNVKEKPQDHSQIIRRRHGKQHFDSDEDMVWCRFSVLKKTPLPLRKLVFWRAEKTH